MVGIDDLNIAVFFLFSFELMTYGVRSVPLDDEVRHRALEIVGDLEGHADNAAASLFGGVVAVAGGRVARIPLGIDPAVVVWIPATATKTDESRRVLPTAVGFDDAVFNIGRVALLVASLASGTIEALAAATHDRLHQPARLRFVPGSAAAIEAALAAGAWCSWLSGSGPTVAALCHRSDAEDIAAHLPADGHTKVLRIDHEGATIESHRPHDSAETCPGDLGPVRLAGRTIAE